VGHFSIFVFCAFSWLDFRIILATVGFSLALVAVKLKEWPAKNKKKQKGICFVYMIVHMLVVHGMIPTS
jgi:uncharacterized membrane protein